MRKHINYEKVGWVCDFCEVSKLPAEKSYHCKKCGMDICDECFTYVKEKSQVMNLHSHDLILNQVVDWTCRICKNKR